MAQKPEFLEKLKTNNLQQILLAMKNIIELAEQQNQK